MTDAASRRWSTIIHPGTGSEGSVLDCFAALIDVQHVAVDDVYRGDHEIEGLDAVVGGIDPEDVRIAARVHVDAPCAICGGDAQVIEKAVEGNHVAVGPGGVSYSSDDGGSWMSIAVESYWSLAFTDGGVGFLVGPEGRLTRIDFEL